MILHARLMDDFLPNIVPLFDHLPSDEKIEELIRSHEQALTDVDEEDLHSRNSCRIPSEADYSRRKSMKNR